MRSAPSRTCRAKPECSSPVLDWWRAILLCAHRICAYLRLATRNALAGGAASGRRRNCSRNAVERMTIGAADSIKARRSRLHSGSAVRQAAHLPDPTNYERIRGCVLEKGVHPNWNRQASYGKTALSTVPRVAWRAVGPKEPLAPDTCRGARSDTLLGRGPGDQYYAKP